ncbi:MAG TPA: siderophore-interacting protein [Nocardioidaceae bacterium]|nr:siderophore-interacting protein [Nocardioidaceae bacterium]
MPRQHHKAYPIVVRELEVKEAYDVTPLMRRVVLTGEQLGAFRNGDIEIGPFLSENADDHVKILVPDPSRPDTEPPVQLADTLDWTRQALLQARDYTPRRYDTEAGILELDFVRHDGGLAATWATETRVGDRIHVAGPRGTTVLPDGIDWYLLVGDETALPAIARRIEELPAGTPVTAIVSIPTMPEAQEWEHACDLDLTWLPRDMSAPDALTKTLDAVRWRDGQVYAWAAGEAGMLRGVRAWLKKQGVPREYTDIAGYWRKGQGQDESAKTVHKLQHMADLAGPYALRAAVTYSLAEHVLDGHTTVGSLATAAGVHPHPLRKVLGLLSHSGLFAIGDDDSVSVTTSGQILTDEGVHQRLDHNHGYALIDDGWPGLLHTMKTGQAGYSQIYDESFWDTLDGDESLSASFDESLARWADHWVPLAVRALDVTTDHVVDVGGGTGRLLARILDANPSARGTLVERGNTAALARPELADAGDRVTIAEQSIFDPLPTGDVIVLAQVLHDWPDQDAIALLRRAAEAGPRVVLVERLARPTDDHDAAFDLTMTVLFGGGERTRPQVDDLASQAGLRVISSRPVGETLHLFELAHG